MTWRALLLFLVHRDGGPFVWRCECLNLSHSVDGCSEIGGRCSAATHHIAFAKFLMLHKTSCCRETMLMDG